MKTLAILTLLFLAGCSSLDVAKAGLQHQAASTADRALNDALYLLCPAASSGAINRKWGGNPKKLAARSELCSELMEVQP